MFQRLFVSLYLYLLTKRYHFTTQWWKTVGNCIGTEIKDLLIYGHKNRAILTITSWLEFMMRKVIWHVRKLLTKHLAKYHLWYLLVLSFTRLYSLSAKTITQMQIFANIKIILLCSSFDSDLWEFGYIHIYPWFYII